MLTIIFVAGERDTFFRLYTFIKNYDTSSRSPWLERTLFEDPGRREKFGCPQFIRCVEAKHSSSLGRVYIRGGLDE